MSGSLYAALKHIHLATVGVTALLFIVRGIWMLRDSPRLQQRWVRIVPHINDAVLLMSAIGLALTIQQYPITHHWLSAKITALLAYIVLGSIALKRGRTKAIRSMAFVGALLALAYVISVALTRDPTPWLA